jgi:hypothetical protein
MIKKNGETGKEVKTSFKKFSDINGSGKPAEDPSETILPEEDQDRPGFPNLPSESTKRQKLSSTRYMKPLPDQQDWDKEETSSAVTEAPEGTTNEGKVKLYGKIAKFPKGTKASKGLNFLENVKISKNSIWYLMVEKQDNELQMVKYNYKKGVDLSKFVNELKTFYSKKYSKNKQVLRMIEAIEIDGNDKFSRILNIPLVEVDGKKMITKITEDLIKLLSK